MNSPPKSFRWSIDKSSEVPLLWIQKGSASDSLMTISKNERSLINSHVQHASLYTRKDRKKMASRPVEADANDAKEPADTGEGRPPSSGYRTLRIRDGVLRPRTSKAASGQRRLTTEHTNAPALVGDNPLVWHIQLTTKAVDPFGAASIPIDSQTHSLIQLWLDHFQIWFDDLKYSKANQDLAITQSRAVIADCVQNELSMQCLLAYISSLKENIIYKDEKAPVKTPVFVQRAISALRQRIAAPGVKVDNALIREIYNLACAELFRSNSEEGAMPHFRTVKYLVDQHGGLATLNHQLRMAVIMADVYLAVERLKPPIFPLTWDPGPLPKPTWDKVVATKDPKLGQGFVRDAVLFEGIPELDGIIDDILDLTVIEVFHTNFKDTSSQLGEYISLRQMAILHHLMTLKISPELKSQPQVAVVQTTLALYILLAMTKWIRSALGPLILPRFRRMLERSKADEETNFFEIYPDLALWMLAIGVMTPAKPDAKEWFVNELVEACRKLKVKTGAALVKSLKDYLYLDKMRGLGLDAVISRLDDLH